MAKKKKEKKPAQKAHTLYEASGEKIERKTKACPKCGNGVFMAKHKDRYACGKCNYTEFSKN